MLALKSMSCLFSPYDRPSYSKILPNHLADIQSYPTDLLGCLRAGGFTVKFTGHAVALDEAHEMGINRDMKMKRPNPNLHQEDDPFLFVPHNPLLVSPSDFVVPYEGT